MPGERAAAPLPDRTETGGGIGALLAPPADPGPAARSARTLSALVPSQSEDGGFSRDPRGLGAHTGGSLRRACEPHRGGARSRIPPTPATEGLRNATARRVGKSA